MKLKISFCLLLVVFSAQAQTAALPPSPEPVIVTNRDVFKEAVVSPQKIKIERNPPWHDLRGEVLESGTNAIVVRTFVMKNIYGPVPPSSLPSIGNSSSHLYDPPPMRPVVGQKKQSGAVVALRNFPGFTTVTNGQEIACRAMMTGTYGWGESLIELYDCGSPAMKIRP